MTNALALRLKPEADLRISLEDFAAAQQIQAGFILTAVGSLQQARLRFANQNCSQSLIEKFEIVSLVGTLCASGVHLHIALADQSGRTRGGHLEKGCLVYTTAEIVIGVSQDFVFTRSLDQQTGFSELNVLNPTPKPSIRL